MNAALFARVDALHDAIDTLGLDAEQKRNTVENSFDSNSTTFQENVLAAIQLYEQCLSIADRISLFSPNESLDDIGSNNDEIDEVV